MRIRGYIITSLFPFLLGISTYRQLNSQEITASAYFGVVRENITSVLSPGNIQNGYFTRFDKGGLEAIVIPNITTEPDNVEFRVDAPAGLDIRTDGEKIWSVGPVGNEHISIRYIMTDKNTNAYTFIDLSGEADSLIWQFSFYTDQENYYGFFSDRFGTDVIAPGWGEVPLDSCISKGGDTNDEMFAVLDSIATVEERNPIEAKEGFWRNWNGQGLRETFNYYAHGSPGENLWCELCLEITPVQSKARSYEQALPATNFENYSKNISLSDIRLQQFFPDTVYYAEENNPGARIEDGDGGDGMFYPVEVICPCDTLYESHTTPSNFDFTLDRIEHEEGDSLWRLWYRSETDNTAPLQRTTFWYSPYPVGIQGEEDNYSSTTIPKFQLGQNYPNPFNPSTTIPLELPDHISGNLDMVIYNSRGQRVRTLNLGHATGGKYKAFWDGRDDRGQFVSTGDYFGVAKAGKFKSSRRKFSLRK